MLVEMYHFSNEMRIERDGNFVELKVMQTRKAE